MAAPRTAQGSPKSESVRPSVQVQAYGRGEPQPRAWMGAAVSAKKEAKKRELLENPLVNGVQEGAQLFRLLRRCLKKNLRVKRLVKTKATERGLPQPSSGGRW